MCCDEQVSMNKSVVFCSSHHLGLFSSPWLPLHFCRSSLERRRCPLQWHLHYQYLDHFPHLAVPLSLCFSILCLFFPLNIFLCFSILINRYYSIPRALLLFPQKARYFWVQDSQIPFVSSPRLEGHLLCCGPDEEVVVMAEAAMAQCQALVLALVDFTKGVKYIFRIFV